jgi:outer membrane lipoprotein SlyB
MSMAFRNAFCLLGLALLVFIIQGCAPSASGKVYTRDQARRSMQIDYGTVQQVNQVTIEGEDSRLGTVAGGALGAAAGNTLGGGKGSTLAAVAGGVAGAIAGKAAEKKLTTMTGLEIVVALDNGNIISIVQENDVVFQVGERVRVLRSNDGTSRVTY